jgi:predicted ATPase
MPKPLEKITINGFKSIRALEDFELKNLNVLIGGNGAGKSNFIEFFKLLSAMMNDNLNDYIRENGGISDLLFHSRKTTKKLKFQTLFGICGYRFCIVPEVKEGFSIINEARYYKHSMGDGWWELGNSYDGISELVREVRKERGVNSEYGQYVYDAITSWQIYHFHDTNSNSDMRHYEIVQDKRKLRMNGANIAPFLRGLRKKHQKVYAKIVDTIQLVLPFFDDFILDSEEFGEKLKVNLSWKQQGSDYPMQPYHLSDGSIRFICLATALLQPNPPSTIIIDEPELGLHPQAINILAELIQSASERTQVIISTQSPALIDNFAIEDIIVVNRNNKASTFERLNENDFNVWLEDYSVGELWTKNVIVGGPSHE